MGKVNFEAGRHLVAVEYDGDETAAALRERCARWLTGDTTEIPAAFGVRVAKVGFRRRRIGVVHYGAPVRHRLDGLDAAVESIAVVLADLARVTPAGHVEVAARAFMRDGRVALVDIGLSADIDERPLRARAIEEIPSWLPLVDPSTGSVIVGGRTQSLAGFVLTDLMISDLDSARRRVWSLGTGPRVPWAELIDGLGDRVVYGARNLADALDRLLD